METISNQILKVPAFDVKIKRSRIMTSTQNFRPYFLNIFDNDQTIFHTTNGTQNILQIQNPKKKKVFLRFD